MRLLTCMQPRNRTSALRCVGTLGAVAALVTIAFLPVQPGGRDLGLTAALLTVVAFGLVIAACWAV
jgi:predicted anti-sigma-YlaC factor YlaD